MDAANNLTQKLEVTKSSFFSALESGEFYLEWTWIGLALSISWLMARLINLRVVHHIEASPPKWIDAIFILKPLRLLAPMFALAYLHIAMPFVEERGSGMWIHGVIHLTVAYLLAKSALLIVKTRPIAWMIAVLIMMGAVLKVSGFMDSTTAYLDTLAFEIGKFKLTALSLIHGIIILVLVFWAAGILSSTLESYLRRSSRLSYSARELIVKFFTIFVYFTAIIITLSALGVDLTAFAVFGGALGVGIGLGLQKITANFVSGVTLLLEKSIKHGDLIEVAGQTGWVRQLNIRYALVETFDGRELLIPNEELTSTRVTNWTYSSTKARVEIVVRVQYGSDAKKARELMLKIAASHPKCLRDPAPTCHLFEFQDSGMAFQLTFWIEDIKEGRAGPQNDVMLTLLDEFKKAGIELAQPLLAPLRKAN